MPFAQRITQEKQDDWCPHMKNDPHVRIYPNNHHNFWGIDNPFESLLI
jgi:hypothetical protein